MSIYIDFYFFLLILSIYYISSFSILTEQVLQIYNIGKANYRMKG